MRMKTLAGAAITLGLPLSSLADTPSVAVDIAPLHSLVSQVMDGVSEPNLLIPAEASPHDYALRPSQAQALSDADIVFWMGETFTPWLEKAIHNVADSANNVEMLELATTTYEYREGATFEEHGDHEKHGDHHDEHADDDEHHDKHEEGFLDQLLTLFGSHDDHEEEHEQHHDDHNEEHGDHHGHNHEGVDPHAWLDPENAKAWIKEIETVLSKHDPENAQTYASNAQKATASLDTLINETRTQVDELGALKFIVFHDAYQYFEKRFGILATGSISLGDAEDPSPARISEIRETVEKLGVTCVFTEPQYNPGLVKNVFEGTTVTDMGVMDPLGASINIGASHYSELIGSMVASLNQCKQ